MSWLEGVNSTLNLHSNTSSSLVCTNLYDHRPVARVLMSLHYSLVFMLGLLGNALALHVIRPNLAQINSTTLYSANLAASDVLFTLALPLRIAYYALGFHWPLGETLCRVTALLFYVNTYAGVNFMTCLAVDRFVAVVLPLRYTRLCRARTIRYVCIGVWVLVLVQTLPLLSVTMTRAEPDGTTTCMEYPNFENGAVEGLPYVLIGAVVVGYGVPVATILCCYLVLLWKLRLVTRSGVGGRGHRSLRSQKATGVIAGVVLVFVVCFSPYHINILQYMIRKLRYTPDCTELQAFQVSLHFTVCLMNLNCCLDPFVYFFACKGYKRRVMKMLRVQVSASFSSVVRTGEDTPFKWGGNQDGRSRLGSRTVCPVALDNVTNTIPGPETETGAGARDRSRSRRLRQEPGTETGAGD
ncbi:G-protein coupled receptor 183-like isoform X1 [Salvelinus fontinalis]|uniref:G-protein coupled receptor 183-like isoform X1 n=1 Tax=Salvelinus fontinalis TaxID=8038 RepID=UPI002486C49A|nr:G-protein coupled receptor 183-like isoform X1 [Salvelinus fontinalis]XP_055771396.1 G-protein coupled receptor 183-like isoform X1 [Salvelinus fontinalis]